MHRIYRANSGSTVSRSARGLAANEKRRPRGTGVWGALRRPGSAQHHIHPPRGGIGRCGAGRVSRLFEQGAVLCDAGRDQLFLHRFGPALCQLGVGGRIAGGVVEARNDGLGVRIGVQVSDQVGDAAGDLPALLAFRIELEQRGMVSHLPEKELAPYNKLLKEQLRLTELEIAEFVNEAAMYQPEVPVKRLTPESMLDMLKADIVGIRQQIAGIARDLVELKAPGRLKSWLQEPN